MLIDSLVMGYGIAELSLQKNLEGVTDEESLTPPGDEMNCINWVVGHILVCRDHLFKKLGEEAIFSEEEGAPYQQGAKPIKPGDKTVDITRCVKVLQES